VLGVGAGQQACQKAELQRLTQPPHAAILQAVNKVHLMPKGAFAIANTILVQAIHCSAA
jgi:hypothetical protein